VDKQGMSRSGRGCNPGFARGIPAVLGGPAAFPSGLPIVKPSLPPWRSVADPLAEVLESRVLTKGPKLAQYESAVAALLGVEHAVAVSSCTAGLMLTYRLAGLRGEVVLPSFTFTATAQPLLWNGLEPVFADIDAQTLTLSPNAVRFAITSRTSAIIAVHTGGNPADIAGLDVIAKEYGLLLIFDAAHAFGSLYQGKPLGGHGSAEVFSTSPTKLLVTGEGGIVATNDDELADRVRTGREYGNPGNYDALFPAMNARLTEQAAVLGLRGLGMLEQTARRRNDIAERYIARLGHLPGLRFQQVRPGDRSSYKDFMVVVGDEFPLSRDEFTAALQAEGIATRDYYNPPVHRQTAFRKALLRCPDCLPVTDDVALRVTSLPAYALLEDGQVEKVTEAVERIYEQAEKVRDALAGRIRRAA
jgi:dTDP-4-amino-4,6-dideoxygalactose transaminase